MPWCPTTAAAINDVLQAVGWLQEQGASSVSLYGDSSGATQVVQTLLLLAHRKNTGEGFAPHITSAITFSAWLDLTGYEAASASPHCFSDPRTVRRTLIHSIVLWASQHHIPNANLTMLV